MKKTLSIIALGLTCALQAAPNVDQEVESWMHQLKLEDKINLIVGMGMKLPDEIDTSAIQDEGFKAILDSIPEPVVGVTQDKVPGAAGTTYPVPELGIQPMVLADGPAGLRISPTRKDSEQTYYATAFPIGTLLASSWDEALVESIGESIGKETLEYGVDIILMPALNLHRNPLCGRNFEYFSEDPLVSGKMAAAMVRGVQSQGVGTSIKHYAVNNQETNRNSVNAIATERTLRELYLRGFEIAVNEATPWTVMSSYNRLNGTFTSERDDLLTTVLRDEWGFEGFVMTDWFGGSDAAAQIKVGNDLLMPGTKPQREAIAKAIEEGTLTEAELELCVERILKILAKSPSHLGYAFSDTPDLKAHAKVAREAATEGMVLLKNEGSVLPLQKQSKLAVFGKASFELISGGTGSGDVNEAYSITLLQGLEHAHIKADTTLSELYETYFKTAKANQPKPANPFALAPPVPEMELPADVAEKAAESNDVAVVILSRNSGEFADRKLEDDFLLSKVELDMLETVSSAFRKQHKPVVAVLNIGGVIETASWRDLVDSILIAWQPGQEGGDAIADVLTGTVNPSGKLPMTFPIRYEDIPAAANFPGTPIENPTEVVYEEGLYVGYRYFDSFDIPVAYPFGYGISYTTFDYATPEISSDTFDKCLEISVKVTNSGKVAGKEVVQLYLAAPSEKLSKPHMELKSFAKTQLLKPGESETVTLKLDPRALASYDPEASAWVAEAGIYTVNIGASSSDIRAECEFELPENLVVEQLHSLFATDKPVTELKR